MLLFCKVTKSKGQTDALSDAQYRPLLQHPVLAAVTDTLSLPGDWISLWIQEKDLEKIDLCDQDKIRVKTRGNTPLIGIGCRPHDLRIISYTDEKAFIKLINILLFIERIYGMYGIKCNMNEYWVNGFVPGSDHPSFED